MSKPGKLYLLPVPISEDEPLRHIPVHNADIVKSLKYFIAEDAKNARRALKLFSYPKIEEAEILLLNEHTESGELGKLMSPLLSGQNVGLMSDAGCPGIADPGADIARLAHKAGAEVVPLTGPSSIVLSIMASGFNGQNFAFNGYLPVDREQRRKRLKELEQQAQRHRQAQFFIETPYRNEQMLDTILNALSANTLVFMGIDIGSSKQKLITKTVAEWKKGEKPALHKIPAVFGIYA